MKTLGMSLFGAKKGGKRRSLVNTPDVLVTGDAAHMAREIVHFPGPEKCALFCSVSGPRNVWKRYELPSKVARPVPGTRKISNLYIYSYIYIYM